MSVTSDADGLYYGNCARVPEIFDAWTGKFLGSMIYARDAPATAEFRTQIRYSNPQMTILQ
jgi:hypothetical protein